MVLSEIQLINKDEEMPRYAHGSVAALLMLHIGMYLLSNNLGELLDDPEVQLVVTSKRVRPDIAYFSYENLAHFEGGIFYGAPDLVIEIISPASLIEDTEGKKMLYAAEGVPEYWVISPEMKTILVYELNAGKYELRSHAAEKGIVTSVMLPGFELEAASIFKGVRLG